MNSAPTQTVTAPKQRIDSVLPLVEVPPVIPALLFEALWLLIRFDLVASFKKFSGIHQIIRNCPLGAGGGPKSTEMIVTDVHSALQRACGYYPKTAACLQRSAALTWMLRKRGLSAQVVIGVMKFPFKSHAWVELDGKVLNDGQRIREMYITLDRLGSTDREGAR